MKKFDFVRIYDDERGFVKPYSNIEFVVSKNILKRFITAWSPLKIEELESFSDSKLGDGRLVFRPQNYEQFKKYLQETQIDKSLNDIKIVYEQQPTGIFMDIDRESVKDYSDVELGKDGYEALIVLAKEMLYDDRKKRDEKTENHLKRSFGNECYKMRKDMIAEYKAKNQQPQKQ